jgi:threonine aldolase
MIELRSDTFTRPTRAMIEAMAAAPLGDDVYGEDPTVRELEELAAGTLGHEAACLTPSGTMANLAALMAHAARGTSALVGTESDIYVYEAGGASVCGGIVYQPIANRADGRLDLGDLAAAFPDDPADPQFALPAVICLENTQNRCGGVVLDDAYLADVRRFADARGVAVHLDGARVFNAAVAAAVPVADIARHADSVQFCLSKGLGAPIGSVVVGSADFIERVRRVRKMLGGGMRQAGVIAAAGIVAIRTAGRLADDHANARRLAEGLASVPGLDLDPAAVVTNIVMFRVDERRMPTARFIAELGARGVSVAELGHGRVRAVTHVDVSTRDVDEAIAAVDLVLKG